MIHRLSASRLGLARRCTYWAKPETVWVEREPSREARLGTAFHAAAESAINADVPPAPDYEDLDDDQVDTLDRLIASWWSWWRPARKLLWEAERAVAWDVRTGKSRWLTRTSHREYGDLEDYEVPGTIDALAYDCGDSVFVTDWKTGRSAVEAPATNPQLAHNGGAAASAYGASGAIVTYAKVSEDAVYVPEPAELDSLAIEATRDELAGIVDSVAKSEPVPGPWCNWCPAKGSCPETAAAVEQVVSATSIVRRTPMSLEIRDSDHAAGMLTAVDAIESFISELKARLRAYADANGGIHMPDGTVYSRTDVTTERPDLTVDGAWGALCKAGLASAIKESVTWADIRRVGGKDGEFRARALLRSMGATKTTVSPRYEAKAKKGRAA